MNVGVCGWYWKQHLVGLWTPCAQHHVVPALQSSWTSHGRQGHLRCCFSLSCFHLSVYKEAVSKLPMKLRREVGTQIQFAAVSYMTHWQSGATVVGREGRWLTTGQCLVVSWDGTHGWVLFRAEQGQEQLLQTEKNRGCAAPITDTPPHRGGCCCCFCF